MPLVPPALELIRSSQSAKYVVGRALQEFSSNGTIFSGGEGTFSSNGTFSDGEAAAIEDAAAHAEVKLETLVMTIIISAVVGGIIHVLFVVGLGCCYRSKVTDKRKSFPSPVDPSFGLKKDSFPFGTCSCFEDTNACCFGWCCTPCRVADTFTAAGVSSFWKMVTAYLLATTGASVLQSCLQADQTIQLQSMMEQMLGGNGGDDGTFTVGDNTHENLQGPSLRSMLGTWSHLLLWTLYALLMASERRKLRKKLGGKKSKYCPDCLCYFFCFCCTIIQDARTVDQASDTEVMCPCKLVRLNKLNSVGEPVSVSENDSDSDESD